MQLVQVLDRHDLARKEDRAQRRRGFIGQRVHRRQEAERADRPDHQRHAAVAEEIHQLCRVGEIRRRHDFHARPREQAAVNILDGYVEVKRRLIGQHVLLRDGERLRKAGDEFAHVAVADDHALRRAGRAAGEIDVERVRVDHLRANGGQRGRVGRRFFQLLDEQDARGRLDALKLSQMRPVGDDDGRIQRFEHRADARRGVAQVELGICAPGIDRAHEAHDGLHALVHIKADDAARRHERNQRGGDALRAADERGKAHFGLLVGKGDFFRQTRGGLLQSI